MSRTKGAKSKYRGVSRTAVMSLLGIACRHVDRFERLGILIPAYTSIRGRSIYYTPESVARLTAHLAIIFSITDLSGLPSDAELEGIG